MHLIHVVVRFGSIGGYPTILAPREGRRPAEPAGREAVLDGLGVGRRIHGGLERLRHGVRVREDVTTIQFLQHKLRMRRGLATMIVFLVGLGLLAGMIYAFVKPIAEQAKSP